MEVGDKYCMVQKFTDRQFRGKKYRVRRSDIIKVENNDQNAVPESENELNYPLQPKTTNSDHPDSSEDEDPASESEDGSNYSSSREVDSDESLGELPNLRRSSRTRRPPPFLSENYVMQTDSE